RASRLCSNCSPARSLRSARPRISRLTTSPTGGTGWIVGVGIRRWRDAGPCTVAPDMHVVIMGCGRVGSTLAHILERQGHTVAVIDRSPEAFRRLGPDFEGRRVT